MTMRSCMARNDDFKNKINPVGLRPDIDTERQRVRRHKAQCRSNTLWR